MVTKICKKCLIEKSINEYNKDKYSSDGLRYRCRECTSLQYKKYYEENRLLEIERQVTYQKNNNDSVKQVRRKRYHIRYNSDLLYKLKINIRNRIKHFIKNKNFDININSTYEIIGCTPNELRIYIEKQFIGGMTWENYKHDGWHIDHIIPLSSAKSIDDVYKLCHYTNLKPLWANENYKKGNKLI